MQKRLQYLPYVRLLLIFILANLPGAHYLNALPTILERELLKAVCENNYMRARKLLRVGIDPNLSYANGDTVLHVSARKGSVDMVFLLLAHGSNTFAKNNNAHTPLNIARARVDELTGADEPGWHLDLSYQHEELAKTVTWRFIRNESAKKLGEAIEEVRVKFDLPAEIIERIMSFLAE